MTGIKTWFHAAAFAVLAISCLPSGARAQGFDVRPISIETRDGSATLVVTNSSDRQIYLETQIYDWSQTSDGQSVLSESAAAVASPPATWVAARSTYNMRLKFPAAIGKQERSFRVMVKQLPDRSDIQAGRIVLALTQSIPAFVEPPEIEQAAIHAQYVDNRHVVIVNDGGHRRRIANVSQDGKTIAPGLAGYALSHARLSITLAAPVHPGLIEVETPFGVEKLELR